MAGRRQNKAALSSGHYTLTLTYTLSVRIDMSNYTSNLNSEDAYLYFKKLTLENGDILPDPYSIDKGSWIDKPKLWPNIGYHDIVRYFVERACFYSEDEVQSYKSLEGYHYFVCGHVQRITFHDPQIQDYVYLYAEVLPSQRQGTKKDMYKAYIVAKKTGQILTVHCTCMAGLGKACSHTAAIAYKVEACIRTGMTETSCTSTLCAWNDLSKRKVKPSRMREMDLKRPKYGDDVRVQTSTSTYDTEESAPSCSSIDFESLKNVQPTAVIFTSTEVKESTPLPLTPFEVAESMELFDKTTLLSKMSESLNAEKISNLEQCTVTQSKSNLWFLHRKGRITSSKMHRVFTLRPTTNRDAMVKEIINPGKVTTPSISYGIKNEKGARMTYSKYQCLIHDEFVCSESGLVLNKQFPHLGASPDGIIQCKCCGKGCLEIKCLKTYENGIPDPDTCTDTTFPINEDFALKQSHHFYTQVQGHMLITDTNFCDLYLWSRSKSLTVRVYKDNNFISKLIPKLTTEYLDVIFPRIMDMMNNTD